MKKLIIAAAIVCAAAMSQAATYKWSFSNLYQPNSTSALYSGDVTLWAQVGSAAAVQLGTKSASGGALSSADSTIVSEALAANQQATFWFTAVFTDSKTSTEYTYTSATKKTTIQSTSDTTLSFLSQKTNSQKAPPATPGWVGVPAPEPTSAMLMLLGMAGLALKRKRA